MLSCAGKTRFDQAEAERGQVQADLDRFRAQWLAPARVAPPTIDFELRTATRGAYVATARPLRPESAAWNRWDADELRLFNNRAALLFEIEVRGPVSARWVPEATAMRLNDDDAGIAPARQPDELLLPLLEAALAQERHVLEGDLVERTRAAGPFRSAYFPLAQAEPPLVGVVAFPLEDPDRHVVAVRLALGVDGPAGRAVLDWSWD